MKCNIYFFYWS